MYLVIGVIKLMIGFVCAVMTRDVFDLTWGRFRYAPEKPPGWFLFVFRVYGVMQVLGGVSFILYQVI